MADHDRILAAAVGEIHGQARPGQQAMADAVATALEGGPHLLVQAGTGTGKSLGYLAPALARCVETDSRVIVATATLALQAQLATKDIPTALDAVEIAAPAGARVRWLARGDADHGTQLVSAVAAWTTENRAVLERAAAPREQHLEDVDVDRDLLWDSPAAGEGEFYAWIAGEAATIKTLRRHLVSDCGVDRRRVAFMGYWRLGQAERAE